MGKRTSDHLKSNTVAPGLGCVGPVTQGSRPGLLTVAPLGLRK
jgi:hypothetical protein